ncbi:hypothetical protein SAMN05421741_12437 [Paenimyroides ummariense]|uniref:Uncharacterized protein n=1 Tax=Paenimyroides ummariense TaxID=913024 RepID=A0A1I5F3H7_9FLAO|nr:hypothetical protein [Paenimyroides ummariense]SFO18223.1 hypothetical protein SAMN05421741_12437 [Paenimyroides ummariense]
MFFVINKIEQVSHRTDGLHNPKKSSNPMVLGIYRTQSRTALFTVYSKKAYGEFWDDVERKKIASRYWTFEMKALAKQKVAEAPKPPYIFKLTIIGWIFVAIMIATMGLIVYQETKPPVPKSAAYVAMEQAPVVGDIYLGRYEVFKEAGERIASEIGFGWFKVIKVEGDMYYMAKSTEMSKTHKPKGELNSTDFETESTPVKITEQVGYMINMKATDDKMEIYITEKK